MLNTIYEFTVSGIHLPMPNTIRQVTLNPIHQHALNAVHAKHRSYPHTERHSHAERRSWTEGKWCKR